MFTFWGRLYKEEAMQKVKMLAVELDEAKKAAEEARRDELGLTLL